MNICLFQSVTGMGCELHSFFSSDAFVFIVLLNIKCTKKLVFNVIPMDTIYINLRYFKKMFYISV